MAAETQTYQNSGPVPKIACNKKDSAQMTSTLGLDCSKPVLLPVAKIAGRQMPLEKESFVVYRQ